MRGLNFKLSVPSLFVVACVAGEEPEKTQGETTRARLQRLEKRVAALEAGGRIEPVSQQADSSLPWYKRFTLGGYGEFHGNFREGSGGDKADLHRLVLYIGYEFNDWISFNSEIEVEHAYVSEGSDGELSFEQAYFDFLIVESFNVRAGRILTPLGIINKRHEPTRFNGVERPSVEKYILPTTWSSDGAGIFGSLSAELRYEAYVVGGLDGSKFTSTAGIRPGRIKERPSFHEPAFTARVDLRPWEGGRLPAWQDLRLGAGTYLGGVDNGNNGSDPGVSGEIYMVSGDFEWRIWRFDFRGVVAHTTINRARKLGNNVAREMLGWYLEAAVHVFPQSLKEGLLKEADLVLFVRYDDFDTQWRMPPGVSGDPIGDRSEWTLGVSFFPARHVVIKADYQIREVGTARDLPDLLNLAIGWRFGE